ncbi:MAG: DUF4290 domain-containing protein [Bacteroidetes bacterium]|jgi:hypothetical protein|nr:DUF4290 domain-containing protein [Bacteroidota bacterium]MBK8367132.1 DUF4290 domain-containing protein [Bacteroidota bacterium]
MEYNTQLPKLEIPEYGRNIQVMIDHCITIEDREERNKCARAIIQIMGQLNPHLRDIADFTHKLWDHLFLISKFQLDVDSPYPRPNAETFTTKPKNVPYPATKIRYKHYGKTIERIIDAAKTYEEGPEKKELSRLIANHLKKSYVNWNKDSVTDDVIFKQFKEMTNNELHIDENSALTHANELKNKNHNNQTPINLSARDGGGGNNKNRHKKNKNKFKHRNNNNRPTS